MENQTEQNTAETTETIKATESTEVTEKATRTRPPRPRCFICAHGELLEAVYADTKDLASAAFTTKHSVTPSKILDGEGVGFYTAKNYNKVKAEENPSDFVKGNPILNMDDLESLAYCVIKYKGWEINSLEMGNKNNESEKYYLIRQPPKKIDESAPCFDFKGPLYIKGNPEIKIETRKDLSF
jgi:hypothetical protein